MTLTDRMISLAQLTLQDPRAATRALLSEGIPLPARTAGLLLVAVLSALLASLQLRLSPQELDPMSALMLGSPLRAAVVQWAFLALSVVLIHRVGRAFGGSGSFPDALLIVVWLQCLTLVLQLLQLVVNMISPALAGIIGLGGFVLFLWLMASFIAELHGFRSRGLVFAGMVVTAFAAGLLIGVVVIVLIGPEALMPNV
ncbi:YIP1 family protein [Rhodobacter sp. SY28-1]|uniref:YIP1 family protein n=1 Tax=Rhodobacter sp. SY28-1 TaxID=2562317 RepID=UPI0010C0623D|nr:YIP1 family protein [Rhodobacter sp. SY28-1]